MAVQADSRIGPPANIVEENVDSDSEARPPGVSSGQYKVLLDGARAHGGETKKERIRGDRRILLQVLPSFRSTFDCSRHRGGTHRAGKTEKLVGEAYQPFPFSPSRQAFFFIPRSVSERIANQ